MVLVPGLVASLSSILKVSILLRVLGVSVGLLGLLLLAGVVRSSKLKVVRSSKLNF